MASQMPLTPTQLRHRKNVAAGLGTASAVIGITTLGARGGQGALRKFGKDSTKALSVANHIEQHTGNALVVGGGIGAAGALNSAKINRTEAKQGVRKGFAGSVKESWKLADAPGAIRSAAKIPGSSGVRGKVAAEAGHRSRSFAAGYSRKPLSTAQFEAGTHIRQSNATSPGAYKAGNLTRKVAVPTAVVGGSYMAGSSLGRRHARKELSKKVSAAERLSYMHSKGYHKDTQYKSCPKCKESMKKSYDYDPEANRHTRAGVATGALAASAAGAGGVGGYSAIKTIAPAKKALGHIKEAHTATTANTIKTAQKAAGGALKVAGKRGAVAAGGLAAGTALAVGAGKLHRSHTSSGSWRSYR